MESAMARCYAPRLTSAPDSASVDRKRRTGDERRLVGREGQYGPCDLLGLSHPAERTSDAHVT